MINYLKLLSFIFLGIGVLIALTIFALKIFFYDDFHENLIVLGPENRDVISKPSDPKGFQVPNLDIEILNNEKALIENKKIRPLPVKPELLPIEVKQEISKQDLKNDKIKTNKVKVNSQPNIKTIQKPVIKENSSLYRVQFGSFKNLDKARIAIKSMNKPVSYTHLTLPTTPYV